MSENFTAKDILKKKGYNIKLKFNIEACIRAISEWFQENDVESCLMLVPYHFARLAGEYPDGFADVAEAANLFVNERMSRVVPMGSGGLDRKSTRLNSSHANISYAVFCLKKKNNIFIN